MKVEGYESAEAYTGEYAALPAGGYVCVITDAIDKVSPKGRRYLELHLDIAEGEYKGYFTKRYEENARRVAFTNPTAAKWSNGGIFRQGYEDKQLPYFKGMITCIEGSNSGYSFAAANQDERTLKGKRVGVVFGREQYAGNDNTLRWSTKPVRICRADKAASAPVPEDKYLNIGDFGFKPERGGDPFATPLGASNEDLPF